jgi:hypothetical protein
MALFFEKPSLGVQTLALFIALSLLVEGNIAGFFYV